jgi:hypothetical protein
MASDAPTCSILLMAHDGWYTSCSYNVRQLYVGQKTGNVCNRHRPMVLCVLIPPPASWSDTKFSAEYSYQMTGVGECAVLGNGGQIEITVA